jgi:hypothetical protein
MTSTVYTDRALKFAELHDGKPALAAKVEREIETIKERGFDGIREIFWFHIFSWHGTNNMIMTPSVDDILVDILEEGGDDIRPTQGNGPEPDMPHSALAKG